MNIDIIILNVVIIFHNSFVKLSIPFWLKNIINQRTEWSLNRTSQKNPLTWRSLSDRRTRTRTPPFNKISQKLSFYLSSAFSFTLPNFSPLTNRQNEIDRMKSTNAHESHERRRIVTRERPGRVVHVDLRNFCFYAGRRLNTVCIDIVRLGVLIFSRLVTRLAKKR